MKTGRDSLLFCGVCVCRVNVTFVNHLGQKVTLPGRAGQTLLDVAQEHDYNWLEGMCEPRVTRISVYILCLL